MSDSFAAPWTIAHQAPLFMGFPRQKFWSGLPFPSPGGLLDPGIEPASPALAGRFFTTEPPGKPNLCRPTSKKRSLLSKVLLSWIRYWRYRTLHMFISIYLANTHSFLYFYCCIFAFNDTFMKTTNYIS